MITTLNKETLSKKHYFYYFFLTFVRNCSEGISTLLKKDIYPQSKKYETLPFSDSKKKSIEKKRTTDKLLPRCPFNKNKIPLQTK